MKKIPEPAITGPDEVHCICIWSLVNSKILRLTFFLVCFFFGMSPVFCQNQVIHGNISDENGEDLPGVTIVIKQATNIGTITDINGNFSLSVPEEYLEGTLVISYVGFTTEEVIINNRSVINLSLTPNIQTLDEIVVVGYGVQEKRDVTGAISAISEEELNPGAITNPLQQIVGKAAGVNVTQIGNEPGTTPTVRIRGITSLIGGNDPLVVVDGIQGNMDLLNQVPPSEIESIDILKDASATAIYGSRGAPGVIIVTTKKSKGSKPSVEYSGTASVDVLADELEVFTAEEWREQARNWNVPISTDHGSDTDWYNLLTQTGYTQNHTISFGGDKGDLNYRASVSAILQQGVVINSQNNNYIASIYASQKALDDKLTLTINLNNSIRKNVGSPADVGRASFRSNLISNAYVAKPTDPVLFEDGSYYFDENVFQYINPYAVAETIVNEAETHNQFASLKADVEIINGLTFDWFGSLRKIDRNTGYYAPAASTLPFALDNDGVANVNTNLTDEKLMNISLNYKKTFGKHKIGGLVLYEWQGQEYQGHFAQAKGFINDITSYNALQLGSISQVQPGDLSSYKNDRKLVSFLGRATYSYADKYSVTVSARRDGSSVFGDDHKWGTFPSAAIAWRISEESFLADQRFVSDLKLRIGYGVTGNQQGLFPQQSLQLVGSAGTIFFGNELISNFGVTQNANPDLQWETRKQANFGLDFGLVEGKLTGTIDAYSATTENLLFNYTVPQPPYPFNSIAANVGSLKNEGLELSLNYKAINGNDLTVTLAGNFTLMRNEVQELGGQIGGVDVETDYVDWGYNAYLIEGQPIGTFNILENNGKNESTNEEEVVDRDGNGIIDQGSQSPDRYIAGSALPTYTFAFTPSMSYKNFTLSMVWTGSGGNKIYNSIRSSFSYFETLGRSNLLKSSTDLGLFTSEYGSDLWLEDGDYVRFQNLSIGYNFNTSNIKYLNALRLSLTGTNLALFTKYSGLDPELNFSGGSGSGADAGIYPRTRSIALGLNATF